MRGRIAALAIVIGLVPSLALAASKEDQLRSSADGRTPQEQLMVTDVPEPASLVLLGAGLVACASVIRRRLVAGQVRPGPPDTIA